MPGLEPDMEDFSKWMEYRREQLKTSEIIYAQAVADFWQSHEGHNCHDGTFSISESFPNIAPPWENFFVEYKLLNRSVGCFVQGFKKEYILSFLAADDLRCQGLDGDGWVIFIEAFCHPTNTNRLIMAPAASMNFYTDDNGGCEFWCNSLPYRWLDEATGNTYNLNKDIPSEPEIEEMFDERIPIIWPTLLATTFLHCRNTVLIEQEPPEKLSRKFYKHHGAELLKYKVLTVEPIRKIFKSQCPEETDIKKCLHICRGHFKDYRERGLFGKFKNLYWWDMHMRGSSQFGAVIKDYKVKHK